LCLSSCVEQEKKVALTISNDTIESIIPDTTLYPEGEFGEMVKYGRELLLRTAFYIGPEGKDGHFTANKMNCTHCHQWAGTKPYSFNLMRSHDRYPQFRAREGKVITLEDRVNNCVTRPHNGIPIPHESVQMVAILSYLKWINDYIPENKFMLGEKNEEIEFPPYAASSKEGAKLFKEHCERCHGMNGEGRISISGEDYQYPPLWGKESYQSGSSMHRVIKMAQWLKQNMPYDRVEISGPVLNDNEVLHLAAFVNDDVIHERPHPNSRDYPLITKKAIDYDIGPYPDTFSSFQHKYGPFGEIISYWRKHNLKPTW